MKFDTSMVKEYPNGVQAAYDKEFTLAVPAQPDGTPAAVIQVIPIKWCCDMVHISSLSTTDKKAMLTCLDVVSQWATMRKYPFLMYITTSTQLTIEDALKESSFKMVNEGHSRYSKMRNVRIWIRNLEIDI